jgi:hypothetical protein
MMKNRQTDGLMDGQTDGRMDGWMDSIPEFELEIEVLRFLVLQFH